MVRKFMLLMLSLCLCANLGFSASQGTSGAQFLKITSAPRPSGMGGAFTAVSGDINSIAFNPAGLASLEKKDAILVQNNWLQDITNQFVAFGLPIKDFGTLGIAVNMLTIKDIKKYDNTATAQGTYGANDMAITLGYAKAVSEKLSLGLNAKSISSKIDDQTASAMAADVGTLYKASSKLDLALAAQNIGSSMKFIAEGDPLPLTIKLGGAYKPSEKLVLALDINSPNDSDLYFAVGGEYSISAGEKLVFPVRVGYRTGMQTGGLSGLGTGLGIMYNSVFGVDLAWNPGGDLGDAMKFGLRFCF
ncbi:MAG: PorV/PorQ family protein [Elusimicrobia bacterium]|nr:PorV/PorQ family protein [Candidatus Liberimonas magnetica]